MAVPSVGEPRLSQLCRFYGFDRQTRLRLARELVHRVAPAHRRASVNKIINRVNSILRSTVNSFSLPTG
jgi:hypothetical protein